MKKIILIMMSILMIVCMLVACGSTASYDEKEYMNEAGAGYPEEEYAYVESPIEAETLAADTTVASNRKLIRTLNLTVETETYTQLLDDLSQRVTRCGGYIENLSADTRDSSSSRYASMTIRIPVEQLENFAGEIGEISNVVQRTESTQDVTLSYVDMESHRNALKTEQERLLALLENAQNLDEILEIERRLTDVRYELESMESQLRSYDNQIEYATIYLDIAEVKVLTPVDEEEKGFWEEIGDGFVNSAESVWEFLKDLFAFVIVAVPYLLLIGVVVAVNVIIIVVIVRSSKKRAKKREQKTNNIAEGKIE